MKELLFALNAVLAADAASTHAVLARGGREVMMPSQNPYVIHGLVAGQAVGLTWGLRQAERSHPKGARIVGWTIVALRAAVVVHNVNQLRR